MIDDPAFSLVPLESQVSEAEALAAAERSVLDDPFSRTEAKDPPLPFGVSWAFDHDRGRFFRSAGGPVKTRGEATLFEYIQAAMRTAAGAYPIFPPEFGIERPQDFLGTVDPTEALSDFQDRMRTSLKAHDRIEDVRDFEADIDLSTGVILVTNLTIVTDQANAVVFNDFDVRPES